MLENWIEIMCKTVVLGGGVAGLAAAVELSQAGKEVIVIEKEKELGGNTRLLGCKAVKECTRCNLCLADKIISEALELNEIEILYQTRVSDLMGKAGNYSLVIEQEGDYKTINCIKYIIVATGFTRWSDLETGNPEVSHDRKIIWASQLEEYLKKRKDHLKIANPLPLGFIPHSAAFIQCNGSRSVVEKARYCSRICCGYSYRMARVLKHFFPEIEITIFFMDLQEGGYLQEITFAELDRTGIDYLNCRPVKFENYKSNIKIVYEDQNKGLTGELMTEMVVLSEGLHSNMDNEQWSLLFNLQSDSYGFLSSIESEEETGIFLAGTIKEPADIAAAISDGKKTAFKIINLQRQSENINSV